MQDIYLTTQSLFIPSRRFLLLGHGRYVQTFELQSPNLFGWSPEKILQYELIGKKISLPLLISLSLTQPILDSSWNVLAHGDAREGNWRGKLANGVGSQYPSHYLGTWCIHHYYRWCAHLGCQQSTELTPPADLNGIIRFAERRNLFSARVPSHFNWPLPF